MIKIVFMMTSCKRSGPVKQMLYIIKNLDRSIFEPYLVTIYNEVEGESMLQEYLPYVIHRQTLLGKIDVILGRDKGLRDILEEISPDVIHSLGAFPDMAISNIHQYKHVVTIRGLAYVDYCAKFGYVKGFILTKLHNRAISRTTKAVTCSESLAKLYKDKYDLEYDYIRNGVDIDYFAKPSQDEKNIIKKELGLPKESFVFVYTGQMIERKNVGFLLETFANHIKDDGYYLLLLGGGALLESYKNKYGKYKNIDFRGNVPNVNHYLKACDAYVSTSLSEGLPNGVLEAMASGLPVVLSDIPQHLEIFNVNPNIGYCYHQGDAEDLARGLHSVMECYQEKSDHSYNTAHDYFSASAMSKKYQEMYIGLFNSSEK